MPILDHLVFAAQDVLDAVHHIERLSGATAAPGGPHLGLGTHNALLSFDDRTYLEIIGADPDQPDPAGPRPFGIDDANPPRLAAYAVRPAADETMEQVAATMASTGFALTDPVSMTRRRPDGVELSWRIAFPASADRSAVGALPFVIDWGDTPSPAGTAPAMGSLVAFTVHHPDPAVRAAVSGLVVGSDVAEGPKRLVAAIETARGTIELA